MVQARDDHKVRVAWWKVRDNRMEMETGSFKINWGVGAKERELRLSP